MSKFSDCWSKIFGRYKQPGGSPVLSEGDRQLVEEQIASYEQEGIPHRAAATKAIKEQIAEDNGLLKSIDEQTSSATESTPAAAPSLVEKGAHLYQRGARDKDSWVREMVATGVPSSAAGAEWTNVSKNWRMILARESAAAELMAKQREEIGKDVTAIRTLPNRKDFARSKAGIDSLAGQRARQASNYVAQQFGVEPGKVPTPSQKLDMDAGGFVIESHREAMVHQFASHIETEFGLPPDISRELAESFRTVDDIKKATNADLDEALSDPATVKGTMKAITAATPAPFTLKPTSADAKDALTRQIAKVESSSAPIKLKKRWLPVMRHALDAFDKLEAPARETMSVMDMSRTFENLNNIPTKQLEYYLTHIYSSVGELTGANMPPSLTTSGGSKYFLKERTFNTLADAIAASKPGRVYDPVSSNAAELTEHRVRTGSRLVETARMIEDMYQAKYDGKPAFLPALTNDFYRIMDTSGPVTRNTGTIYRSSDKWIVENSGTRSVYDTEADAKASIPPGSTTLDYIKHATAKPPSGYSEATIGGMRVHVINELAGPLDTIFNEQSWFQKDRLRMLPVRGASFLKHVAVVGDILHMFNVLYASMASTAQGLKFRPGAFKDGLPLLEYTPSQIADMEKKGQIAKKTADHYRANRDKVDLLQKQGLVTGLISDAIFSDTMGIVGEFIDQNVPGLIGKPFSVAAKAYDSWLKFLFKKLTRGAMVETAIKFYDDGIKEGLHPGEAAKRAADQANDVYGAGGATAWLKSKTGQDLLRITLFAPLWEMGQFNKLGRMAGDIGRIPWDAVHGNFRIGSMAKMAFSAFTIGLVISQVVNFATTGHSTFDNEEGHKMDAYIPGGENGYWFSPMSIIGHDLSGFLHYVHSGQSPFEAAFRVFRNKMSALTRAGITAATGTDYRGRKFSDTKDMWSEVANTLVPMPIPLSASLYRGTGDLLPADFAPEQLVRQAFTTAGVMSHTADTPQTRTALRARAFTPDKGGSFEVSKYANLRRDLHTGRDDLAKKRIIDLLESGTSYKSLLHAIGVTVHKGGARGEKTIYFTGSKEAEGDFLSSMTPSERKDYDAAVEQMRKDSEHFLVVIDSMPQSELDAAEARGEKIRRPMKANDLSTP